MQIFSGAWRIKLVELNRFGEMVAAFYGNCKWETAALLKTYCSRRLKFGFSPRVIGAGCRFCALRPLAGAAIAGVAYRAPAG